MSMEERLAAVERALTDADTTPADLTNAADVAERLTAVEDRLATLETDLADLDAGLQAVRGYAGSIRATNREIERRADAALAATEAVEQRLDEAGHADRDETTPAELDKDRRVELARATTEPATSDLFSESESPIPEPDRTFEPPEPEEEQGPLGRLRDAL